MNVTHKNSVVNDYTKDCLSGLTYGSSPDEIRRASEEMTLNLFGPFMHKHTHSSNCAAIYSRRKCINTWVHVIKQLYTILYTILRYSHNSKITGVLVIPISPYRERVDIIRNASYLFT